LTINLLTTKPARKDGGKMRKPVIVFLVLLLAETISGMVLVYASSASNLFVPPQAASSAQSVVIAKSSLPSPFTVAGWIVGLVAVFGALLSLLLRGRHSSQAEEKRMGERFWAIDSYG
jgi:hypothetical protein